MELRTFCKICTKHNLIAVYNGSNGVLTIKGEETTEHYNSIRDFLINYVDFLLEEQAHTVEDIWYKEIVYILYYLKRG